ncbi:MAG: hypothetical protein ACRDGT_03080, partial [Candidatus Limnocylindria bacterium]
MTTVTSRSSERSEAGTNVHRGPYPRSSEPQGELGEREERNGGRSVTYVPIDARGVARIVIDRPDDPINAIDLGL